MKILIVYAHPEPKSFNGAMLRVAQEALSGVGHEVVVSDLYRQGFRAAPTIAEFTVRADPGHFELMREQAHAAATGTTAADVAGEQARVAWADVILFQFPFWWWSMPAIIKGWVDRILANGFAYGERNLGGKAAMLCITAETRASRFAPDADYPILESIEGGIMRYCGMDVLPRFVAAEILKAAPAERKRILRRFRAHLIDHLGAERRG